MEHAKSAAAIPRRPSGVEPEGRLRGSGFAERQWLLRRDRQFVQVGDLLYRVVELADGSRTLGEIARELTSSTQWEVTPEDVALIIQTRLIPLGLIVNEGAGAPEASRRATSPLSQNARLRVLGPPAIDRVARVLQHLYRPPVVLVALVLVCISQLWMFSRGDPGSALREVVAAPLSLPLIAGLLIFAGVFHEFGHAAALRYGGGRARSIGAGLYLFVPIFYTDVTESYRLRRGGRVRTDLGGLYFHLLAAAAFVAGGGATGNEFLLAAAFIIDLDVARQLVPFIRLDGYWLLADLTGIPDLFAHAGPRLKRRVRKDRRGPVPASLRPGVKLVFVAYTLLALPAIGGLMGYVVWNAPSIFNRTAAAVSARTDLIHETVARGNWTSALLAALEILILALPAIGLAFFLLVIARAVTRFVWRRRAAPGAPAADPVEPGGGLEGDPGPNPSSRAEPEGEPLALQAAIADHLALKRRREERLAGPPPIDARSAGMIAR